MVFAVTGPELSTALQTLGLDTQAAAKWLGVSVRAVQRYRVSGAPGPVAGMVRNALAIVFKRDMYLEKRDKADPFGVSSSNLWDERNHTVEALNRLTDDIGLVLDWRE